MASGNALRQYLLTHPSLKILIPISIAGLKDTVRLAIGVKTLVQQVRSSKKRL
jgi:hypothetical protein